MVKPIYCLLVLTCVVYTAAQTLLLTSVECFRDTLPLMLLRSGDCHPNPGPVYKFPCGVCQKTFRSKPPCIACDSCDIWYHVKFMDMCPSVFQGTQNISWICFSCGIPSFSSTLYESYFADSIATSIATENSYNIITNAPERPPTSPSLSKHTSGIPSTLYSLYNCFHCS